MLFTFYINTTRCCVTETVFDYFKKDPVTYNVSHNKPILHIKKSTLILCTVLFMKCFCLFRLLLTLWYHYVCLGVLGFQWKYFFFAQKREKSLLRWQYHGLPTGPMLNSGIKFIGTFIFNTSAMPLFVHNHKWNFQETVAVKWK